MPHSPRWHDGRLWLLESGTGSLGHVDLATGRYEPIVHLDGFTRGLEMVGNLAFVGLSQVRETAVFSGIQITERLQETERTCGVWVVDIQRGQVVAFLKFEEAVQEIFAVALLAGHPLSRSDQRQRRADRQLVRAARRRAPRRAGRAARRQLRVESWALRAGRLAQAVYDADHGLHARDSAFCNCHASDIRCTEYSARSYVHRIVACGLLCLS